MLSLDVSHAALMRDVQFYVTHNSVNVHVVHCSNFFETVPICECAKVAFCLIELKIQKFNIAVQTPMQTFYKIEGQKKT